MPTVETYLQICVLLTLHITAQPPDYPKKFFTGNLFQFESNMANDYLK